jgi:hypothetical protein
MDPFVLSAVSAIGSDVLAPVWRGGDIEDPIAWVWRDCGGLSGTSRLRRESLELGDMKRFSVGLVTLPVEIGNLVSGPLLLSRLCPLASGSETRLEGPGLGALDLLLLLRCKPEACACVAAAMAR